MEKENQRVVISKRLLKEGLLRLLERKDLDKINVSELCKEAAINRATFYRHYETPRDVLKDIELDYTQALLRSMTLPRTLADVRKATEDMCIYLHEHAELVKVLMHCHTDEEVVRELGNNIWSLYGTMMDTSDTDPDTLRLAITYLAYGNYHLLRQWLMEDIPKDPREIAALISSISDLRWENIICPPRG